MINSLPKICTHKSTLVFDSWYIQTCIRNPGPHIEPAELPLKMSLLPTKEAGRQDWHFNCWSGSFISVSGNKLGFWIHHEKKCKSVSSALSYEIIYLTRWLRNSKLCMDSVALTLGSRVRIPLGIIDVPAFLSAVMMTATLWWPDPSSMESHRLSKRFTIWNSF
jgi:hypothetical protein